MNLGPVGPKRQPYTSDASLTLRRDLAGIVHYDMLVHGRQNLEEWTPLCQPDADWLICIGDQADVGDMPTCLWCITESRKG